MGSWLVRHLRARGDQVDAPPRNRVDVADFQSLRAAISAGPPDVVINLAGVSSVTHGAATQTYEINFLGHLRLLQAVAETAPVARVFLASSANVYGQGTGAAFRECDTPRPKNHYALSKLAAERLHELFSVRTCAVRPFNCIGRGQKPALVVSKLVDAFRRRQAEIELGDVSVERDFVDIRDACAMWEAVLAVSAPPRAVNFGNGEAVRLTEVVVLLEELTQHRPRIVSSPALMRSADITYQRADTGVITGLGYKRCHSLSDTLAWMLAE